MNAPFQENDLADQSEPKVVRKQMCEWNECTGILVAREVAFFAAQQSLFLLFILPSTPLDSP